MPISSILLVIMIAGIDLSTQKRYVGDAEYGCKTTTTCDSAQAYEAFKTLQELYSAYPESCAEYIARETENRRYERVPIYPATVDDQTVMILANCSRIPPIVNPGFGQDDIYMEVPKNSAEGRTLIVRGIPRNRDAFNRFSINFDGPSPKIFFHFVPEMSYSFVINDFVSYWNSEERIDMSSNFTLKYDVEFTLQVTIDRKGYHVTLNGEYFTTFNHRQLPLSDIRQARIRGPVEVTYMSFN